MTTDTERLTSLENTAGHQGLNIAALTRQASSQHDDIQALLQRIRQLEANQTSIMTLVHRLERMIAMLEKS